MPPCCVWRPAPLPPPACLCSTSPAFGRHLRRVQMPVKPRSSASDIPHATKTLRLIPWCRDHDPTSCARPRPLLLCSAPPFLCLPWRLKPSPVTASTRLARVPSTACSVLLLASLHRCASSLSELMLRSAAAAPASRCAAAVQDHHGAALLLPPTPKPPPLLPASVPPSVFLPLDTKTRGSLAVARFQCLLPSRSNLN